MRWEAAENTSGAAGLYNLVYSKPQSHDAPQTREEAEREAEREAEMRHASCDIRHKSVEMSTRAETLKENYMCNINDHASSDIRHKST